MASGSDRRCLVASALVLGASFFAAAEAAPDEVEATRLADTTTGQFTFGGSRPREFTRVGEHVFFAAGTRLTGRELWVTDGTDEGTRLVVELVPGAGDSQPRNLRASDGFLYFEAETAARGLAAWRSDGTAAGTVPVEALPELPPGPELIPGTDDVRHLEFFSAEAEGKGHELFRTDGTVEGTYLVKDIYPGLESSLPGQFTRVGDVVFFSARTEEHGIELWKTDGTAQGTELVKDVRPGPNWGATRHLAALDDRLLLFSGWSEEHQAELWRSDGTEEGTYLVKDLAPALHQAGDPHDIRDMGDGTAYFAAATDLALIELWRTDGTTEGTYLVKDIEPDLADAHIDSVVRAADGVLFLGGQDPNSIGAAWWASDGTTAGTVRRDLSLTGGNAPRDSVSFGDGTIGFGSESALFVSEGLYGPATLVAPALPEPSTTVGGRLIPFGDRTLFQINAGIFPRNAPELWITDGTAEGSVSVGPTSRTGLIEDDYAYLGDSVYIATEGDGLQRTDGSPAGTAYIGTPGRDLRDANSVVSVGDRVLCVGEHRSTRMTNVFAYAPGDEFLRPVSTVVDVRQLELIATRQLRSLWGIGQTALFMRESVDEMWKSDGTARGTGKVADVVPGWGVATSRSDVEPVRVGSRVLFAAITPEHGLELWCLRDGELGATLVADIAPGTADSVPMGLLPLGSSDYAVFAASDGEHGAELWITDGTPEGTTLLSDVRPGPESSNPHVLTQTGTNLFFAASGDAAGAEPWSVPLDGLGLPASAFDGSDGYVSDDEPGGAPPLDLDARRARLKLDFRRDAKDRITVAGALPLPDGFDPEGEVVVVQVGSFTRAFALDRKGRAKAAGARFELRGWRKSPAEARFRLKISGGLKEFVEVSGFTEDVGSEPADRSLRVSILAAGDARLVEVPMSYRVKRRRGKAKDSLE